MCGEHIVPSLLRSESPESAPRVRGIPAPVDVTSTAPGITPACAGNTNDDAKPSEAKQDHPRVCGEYIGT